MEFTDNKSNMASGEQLAAANGAAVAPAAANGAAVGAGVAKYSEKKKVSLSDSDR